MPFSSKYTFLLSLPKNPQFRNWTCNKYPEFIINLHLANHFSYQNKLLQDFSGQNWIHNAFWPTEMRNDSQTFKRAAMGLQSFSQTPSFHEWSFTVALTVKWSLVDTTQHSGQNVTLTAKFEGKNNSASKF